ncbi:hypothetical protein CMV30_17280 [Nibricoccus aquaticus]|uniref:Uncharacterized protein n=1 Tax=Nibricoccus aquaticus TaxID=2576891 RepID=A0A290QLZ8_9BACT|nr:hypothetical protein [Nibricoccus aquaticus]ATC65561.1 hypothetical protein CMV30_17280 [Nibricoccus aquaticus]
MKPAPAFILGLVTGLGLFAAFSFWKSPAQLPAPTPSATPPAHTAPSSTPLTPTATAPTPGAASPVPLESALKEIQEAGMVVIPQEFARFLMPSLISTNPEPAVRQILQLDEREAKALAKARMNFDRAIQQTIDAHLEVIAVKDGVVTATLPAFKEEREKLIAAWRAESLASLDSESAATAAFIDFDRAIESFYMQGIRELAVTFTPSPDAKKILIEYKSDTATGNQRMNQRFQTSMPNSQLLKRFPSLHPQFPQLAEEAKP